MGLNTATFSIDQTSLEAARANILASSTAMVAHLNADLKGRYLSAFADYVTNMESGQVVPEERRTPPKPPNAWELAPPNDDGLVFYQIGTTPVCDMPPLPFYAAGNVQPNATPNMIMLGNRINGNWFQALKGDTFPNGQTTPPMASADGVFGVFEKFGAPVGPGWYLKSA